MATVLTLRAAPPAAPVDGSVLSPDRLAGLAARDLERLPMQVGNRRAGLGDLFAVRGDGSDAIEIEGDLSAFSLIGAGMTRGRLTVRGLVGPRAGSGMTGGALTVEGDAAGHTGEGMRGGLLRLRGAAGDNLAAPPPGRQHGMNRGTILVEGNVGAMAGFRMRRGTLVVTGDCGPGAACGMLGGTLIVLGRLAPGAGALMRRGTIVALGPRELLPVFPDTGVFKCHFLNLYYDPIARAGLRLPTGARAGSYRRHVGDISGSGQGEILALEAER
jgi:formylmethanofuran dehydrogenase subunit C